MARVSQRKHEELGIKQTVYGVGQNWGGRLWHIPGNQPSHWLMGLVWL